MNAQRFQPGDRVAFTTPPDRRGFVDHCQGEVLSTDADTDLVIVRVTVMRCEHPAHPERGRDIPPPRYPIAWDAISTRRIPGPIPMSAICTHGLGFNCRSCWPSPA